MFSILLLLSVFAKPQLLENQDLSDSGTFLIYLYYEKPGFTCPSCSYFDEFVQKIDIPVRQLNFCSNPQLGSKFLCMKFPAFILRNNCRSYIIEPSSGEDLIETLNNNKWTKINPVKWYLETDSKIAHIFSIFNMIIFKIIFKAYYIIDHVPDSVVSLFIIIVITYLIYSIIEIFREPDIKIKED